ncbi:MAG: hypothetical protein HY240_07585 [Actinobacteria bacterium]|nr:hypothetical protein [Actinomycetota bacterium]
MVGLTFDPFTLPVHPAVVHFPMAMLTFAWVCLILRYVTGKEHWDQRARLFEVIGVVSLPVVVTAAFIDTSGFDFIVHPQWGKPLLWHAIVALSAGGTFAAHYLWRRKRTNMPFAGREATIDIGLATAGLWLLITAGLIAGEMVYAR